MTMTTQQAEQALVALQAQSATANQNIAQLQTQVATALNETRALAIESTANTTNTNVALDETRALALTLQPMGPKIDDLSTKSHQARLDLEKTFEDLKSNVQPMVDEFPGLKAAVQAASSGSQQTSGLTARLQALEDAFRSQVIKESAGTTDIELKITEIYANHATLKQHVDDANRTTAASLSGAIAMAGSASAGAGGGGGGRQHEALCVNKLFMNLKVLTGDETRQAIDDWYEDVINAVELILPNSSGTLKWARTKLDPITDQQILAMDQSSQKLSREICGLLRMKTEERLKHM